MNKKALITISTLVLGGVAQANLVAYWNFNSLSTTAGLPSNANVTAYAPTTGAGSIDLAGWTSRAGTTAPHGISNFGGSTVNAISPDPAGQSLALQAGTTAISNNGASLVISFSMAGLQDAIVTFATQRTSTGFNANQVAYSTDGVSYTDFGSAVNPATAFALQTIDLTGITALTNDASVFVRITFTGATSASGNNRVDNVQVNASTAAPEPGTLAALGLGAAAILRRRKK